MQSSTLLNSLVQQNLSGLAEKDFLQDVAKKFPYFIPAQFYLLQQMNEDDALYNQQAAKTAVLFNNPYWLNYQLHQADAATITPDQTSIASTEIMPVEIIEVPAVIEEQQHTVVSESTEETAPILANTIEHTETLSAEQLMLAENPDANDNEPMEEEIAPINFTIPAPSPTDAGNDSTLSFEPMHLVDYFASQGIKLTDEVQMADKLGKQLKSFTEWLKTMKKIHTVDTEANAGISDMAIQTLAAKSNKEGEVVTEAMAEVLVQQGKTGKAEEVYKKLSLLNPSKNAYFAAKIEQLKGS